MYGNPMEIVNELRIYTGAGFVNRPQTPVRFSRSGEDKAIVITVLPPKQINRNPQRSLLIISAFKTAASKRSQSGNGEPHAK
jgi:hypothetical protein